MSGDVDSGERAMPDPSSSDTRGLDMIEATARSGVERGGPDAGLHQIILGLTAQLRRAMAGLCAVAEERDRLAAELQRLEDASSSPQSASNPRERRQATEEAAVLEEVRRRGKVTGASRDPSCT
jgi:hypothetical protein